MLLSCSHPQQGMHHHNLLLYNGRLEGFATYVCCRADRYFGSFPKIGIVIPNAAVWLLPEFQVCAVTLMMRDRIEESHPGSARIAKNTAAPHAALHKSLITLAVGRRRRLPMHWSRRWTCRPFCRTAPAWTPPPMGS